MDHKEFLGFYTILMNQGESNNQIARRRDMPTHSLEAMLYMIDKHITASLKKGAYTLQLLATKTNYSKHHLNLYIQKKHPAIKDTFSRIKKYQQFILDFNDPNFGKNKVKLIQEEIINQSTNKEIDWDLLYELAKLKIRPQELEKESGPLPEIGDLTFKEYYLKHKERFPQDQIARYLGMERTTLLNLVYS